MRRTAHAGHAGQAGPAPRARWGAKRARAVCSECGCRLPTTVTYMEEVQLESERHAQIWRYFCEECLDRVEEFYETRTEVEYRAWQRRPGGLSFANHFAKLIR